jgi:hypothetical protein
VTSGEVGELPLEIGQTLGQPVALLAQRLGRRLDVRGEAPVPVCPLSRDVVHVRRGEQERCRTARAYGLRASETGLVQCDTYGATIGQADTPEIHAKAAC